MFRSKIRRVVTLSYVYFGTNNLERAIGFYNAALGPLGMERCVTGDPDWDRIAAGWGTYEDGGARELAFWIGKPFDQKARLGGQRQHDCIQRAFVESGRQFPCGCSRKWRRVRGCSWAAAALRTGLLCRLRTRSRWQ